MSTVQQKRTPENTPRDLEEISLLGHYAHTGLVAKIEEAGVQVFNNKEEKDAFLRANNTARGEIVYQALLAYDAATGGKPAAAPARQPVTQTQQAAPTRQPATQRAPVTTQSAVNGNGAHAQSSYGLSDKQQPAAAQGQGAPSASQLLVDLLELMKTMAARQDAMETVMGALGEEVRAVLRTLDLHTKSTEAVTDLLATQGALLSSTWDVSRANLGLLSLFGQQVLQAPKEDFLADALAVSDEACEILATEPGEGKGG